MPMIHRKADLNESSNELLPTGILDDKKDNMGTAAKFYRVGGFLCFLGLFVVLVTHNGTSSDVDAAMGFGTAVVKKKQSTSSKGPPSPMDDYPNLEEAFERMDGCVVQWTPPPPKSEWDTKPLWLSAFPGSGSTGPTNKGDIMKPLINGITGLKAGGKFYHASSKILKRCKGNTETATCAEGHPVVNTSPEKQVNNFYHSIILLIRNYRTAFPVHINEKAEAYHDATEQVKENSWRSSRDEWYKEVYKNWKSVVTAWRDMKEYDIGTYLQYEELMDPNRGPAAVQRVADLLQSAGFTVAPKEDLPCIWFNVVKAEYLRLKEYCKHSYGFTKEQQEFLLQELEAFQKEVADDKPLVAILKEYYEDIRDNTHIDIPHQTR